MSDTETDVRPAPQRAKRRLDTSADRFSWWRMAGDAFRTPAGMVAILVIVVQALVRGSAVRGGFFTQDDYLMLRRAADEPMGLDHLLAPHSAEFSPIGNLLVWATHRVVGFSWGGVSLVVLVLQAAAAALVWVVLTQVLEDRWVKVPLLAVACFTPATLGATLWWGMASTHLPTVVLLLAGVSALLAHQRHGWQGGAPVGTVALLLVLLCSDRSLSLPFVAFVALAAMVPGAAGVRERVVATARGYAKVWLVLLVALVARALLGAGREGAGYGWPETFGQARYVAEQYGRQLVAGLVGGPWTGSMTGSVLVPEVRWPFAVAALVCLLLAVPLFRSLRDPVVRVAGLGLVLHVVLGLGVLLLTKEGFSALAMVSRFVADVAPTVVVVLALALRRSLAPAELRRFVVAWPGVVATGLAVAVALSSAVTSRAMVPTLKNEDDRAYVNQIRTGLTLDPRIVLLDGPVPEGVMSSLFGNRARVSTLAGLFPEQPTFGMPSEVLRMVDGAGILREVDLSYTVANKPGPHGDCGWAVKSQQTDIPLETNVAAGNHVLEISYLTSDDTYAELVAGEDTVRVPIRAGVHRVQVPVTSSFSRVRMTLETTNQTLCVARVVAGVPTPAPLTAAP